MRISGRSTGRGFLRSGRIIDRVKTESNGVVYASFVHVLPRERTEQPRRRLGGRQGGCLGGPAVPRPAQVPAGQRLGQREAVSLAGVASGRVLGVVYRARSLAAGRSLVAAEFDNGNLLTAGSDVVFTGFC